MIHSPIRIASLLILLAAPLLAAAPSVPAPAAPAPGSPTLITLHHKNAPAPEVLQDLFRQVGHDYITYPDSPANWPAVSLDADNESYWQVVARLDDALGVHTYLRRNGKIAVNRSASSPETGMRCFSGPCLLLANNVSHTADFTDPAQLDDCVINVTLLTEPNLAVAAYAGRVRPDLAVDERGNSLVPPPAATNPNPSPASFRLPGVNPDLKPVNLDTYSSFQIVLHTPPDAGYKIAQVRGNAHLQLIEKSTVIEIPAAEFATPRNVEFHGARIAISAINNSGDGPNQAYRVSLNITHTDISDEQWAKVNDLLDVATISILDDKGFSFFTAGSGGGGGRASVNRLISGSFRQTEGRNVPDYQAGPPVTCRIVLPETVRDLPIPFEFKNLPLP